MRAPLGAADFVAKPCNPGRSAAGPQGRWRFARSTKGTTRDGTSPLIGNSPAIEKLRVQLRQYADLPFPVLIEGESGSGKEIIASSCLHYDTQRRENGRSWRSIVPRYRRTWLKQPCLATPEVRLPAP
jgi:DNA-binding NtrC family response regulator